MLDLSNQQDVAAVHAQYVHGQAIGVKEETTTDGQELFCSMAKRREQAAQHGSEAL